MKRPRKSPAGQPRGIAPEVSAAARDKLQQDYIALVNAPIPEDSKAYAARLAAAKELLDHLARLRDLEGEGQASEAEPTPAEVLRISRAAMADENKT